MNIALKNIVTEATLASDEGRMAFPEVVRSLMEARVERYHADLILSNKTYYWPDGSNVVVPCHETASPTEDFSAEGVREAVRSIQGNEINYIEFCRRLAQAGCVGYFVTMKGERAFYYGRSMDHYIELFPGAKTASASEL